MDFERLDLLNTLSYEQEITYDKVTTHMAVTLLDRYNPAENFLFLDRSARHLARGFREKAREINGDGKAPLINFTVPNSHISVSDASSPEIDRLTQEIEDSSNQDEMLDVYLNYASRSRGRVAFDFINSYPQIAELFFEAGGEFTEESFTNFISSKTKHAIAHINFLENPITPSVIAELSKKMFPKIIRKPSIEEPIAIIDTCCHSGSSINPIIKNLKYLGFKNIIVYSVDKPDYIVDVDNSEEEIDINGMLDIIRENFLEDQNFPPFLRDLIDTIDNSEGLKSNHAYPIVDGVEVNYFKTTNTCYPAGLDPSIEKVTGQMYTNSSLKRLRSILRNPRSSRQLNNEAVKQIQEIIQQRKRLIYSLKNALL